MNTIHPMVFARFKRWMSELKDRDPRKKARDRLQAETVEEVVAAHLPHLRPTPTDQSAGHLP